MSNNWEFPVAFYFEVEIGTLKTAFKEVSGLSAEIELETVKEGGVNNYEHRLPKQIKHGNLVLKRALRQVKYSDMDWIRKILEGDFSQPISPKALIVNLLNGKGEPIYSWTCEAAYPVKWDVESLDSEKNSILIETLEFTYTTLLRS